ncbi:putative dual specificity phosphatase [Rosellinia necatrix]|uniref:Putative dual specificity phosphatase n=1 Tax=Rosellinia necatrix TaxID=77044 RepID=A0A1W2TUB0_ROSNE|nr:putative dual specificity phosphatase [Rosellinia necatrix]
MATIALPRPVPTHRSSADIVSLASPLSLETALDTQQTAAACPVPIPNKHIPACPTGPALVRAPNTPPPSPGREDYDDKSSNDDENDGGFCRHYRQGRRRLSSLLHPPSRYPRVKLGSLSVFELSAGHVAAAIHHTAKQPLPDPSQVFPWFHGLHPSNHMQQAFFIARKKRALRRTPCCLRGLTVVKANGNLCESRLKGAISPQEFMRPGAEGEFIEMDPKEGFSVRNFHIQPAKTAVTSDIIVYGDDVQAVRTLGWKIASAQAKWREKNRAQGPRIPDYNTFICVTPFAEFEKGYSDVVAVSSSGLLTGAVLDFFYQERIEMYAMAKASEISKNVWLGPTPEPGSEAERQYDVLIECSDLGRLNPAALQAIAEKPHDGAKRHDLDFPSSGSIPAPTWSHADADGILETCQWIWHLAHGSLPVEVDTDPDGDVAMSGGSHTPDDLEPRRILIHCADGYTESTMLAIAYFSYSTGRPIPDAWLDLHTVMKRNFFAYPTDVSLLTSIAARLLHESPVCRDKDLSEITAMVQNEPKWFTALDGSLPSRVLDYMYLGNLGHANNPDLLKALGITQILSVGETAMWREGELEDWGEDNVLIIQGVQDNGIDPLTDEFERCLEFIDRGRKNGTATLVHCRVGVSRSATICIAEVMRSLNMSFPRAYCFVRARRLNVIIQPHLRFAYELLKWEELLRATRQRDHPASELEKAGRELEWGEIAREIALMNRPYAR